MKAPCGECHLLPGEICDVCGAIDLPPDAAQQYMLDLQLFGRALIRHNGDGTFSYVPAKEWMQWPENPNPSPNRSQSRGRMATKPWLHRLEIIALGAIVGFLLVVLFGWFM